MNISINRQLLGIEDILLGVGTVVQTRAGVPVTVTKINATNLPFDEENTLAEVLSNNYPMVEIVGLNILDVNSCAANMDTLTIVASDIDNIVAATGAATEAAESAAAALLSEQAAKSSELAASSSSTSSAGFSVASQLSAEASQTSAEASEAARLAAEALLDTFDDRYLGAFTSPPIVDNDGEPLQNGAMYFNNTSLTLSIYDLPTTAWIAVPSTTLNSLTDVALNSLSVGEVLMWDGTKWYNSADLKKLLQMNKDMHEATGFINKDLLTRGKIELCTDGVLIHGLDFDGKYYTNSSGKFGLGTPFEEAATIRTVAIFPADGQTSFDFYVQGNKHIETTLHKIQVTATAVRKAIYFDDLGVIQYTDEPTAEVFRDYAVVSVIYGNPGTGEKVVHADERHGINMAGETHYYLHRNMGTQYNFGLGINGLTAGSTSYTSIDSGQIQDEDLIKNISLQTNTPFWYIDTDAWRAVNDGLDIGYITVTRPNYSKNNGDGTFTLTEMGNNDFMIMHFMATNDGQHPVVKVLGQNTYNSVADAQAAIETEAAALTLGTLPSPEFRFLYSVIIGDAGDIRLLSDGSTFLDLRETLITGTGNISGTTTSHDNLLSRDSADSHPISAITDLETELDGKAPLESPTLTGTPTAPTPTTGDDSTKLATTAFVLANGVDISGKANKTEVIGISQSWQSMIASRAVSTTYTNTTGKPIQLGISASFDIVSAHATSYLVVDGKRVAQNSSRDASYTRGITHSAIVPNGSTYSITVNNGSVLYWIELR